MNTPQRVDVERLRAIAYWLRRFSDDGQHKRIPGPSAGQSYEAGVEVEGIADALLQQFAEQRDELATLQVIHNGLRRDHERSKAQAKAAREIAEQWNADARAEGFGGGSVKGREIIEAMEAAFLAANGGSDEPK